MTSKVPLALLFGPGMWVSEWRTTFEEHGVDVLAASRQYDCGIGNDPAFLARTAHPQLVVLNSASATSPQDLAREILEAATSDGSAAPWFLIISDSNEEYSTGFAAPCVTVSSRKDAQLWVRICSAILTSHDVPERVELACIGLLETK